MIYKSLARLSRISAPQAYLPYLQSLSRFGLLEPRIETTLHVRLNPYLLGRYQSHLSKS